MSVYRSKNSQFYEFDFQWRGRRFHGSTKRKNRRDAEKVEQQERERAKLESAQAKKLPTAMQSDAAVGRGQKEVGQHHARSQDAPRNTLRTPKYAAERLACSLQTLLAYVRTGTLKYVQVGLGTKRPRRMYTDADLDELIAQQTKRDTPLRQFGATERSRHISNIRSR